MLENDLFAKAYAEVDSPEDRQVGLQARCFSEAGGDESKAKAAYISMRVKELSPKQFPKDQAAKVQPFLHPFEGQSHSPASIQKKKGRWWLWIPLGLVSAFLGYGFLIPENAAEANAFFRVCRDEMVIKGLATMKQCLQGEQNI